MLQGGHTYDGSSPRSAHLEQLLLSEICPFLERNICYIGELVIKDVLLGIVTQSGRPQPSVDRTIVGGVEYLGFGGRRHSIVNKLSKTIHKYKIIALLCSFDVTQVNVNVREQTKACPRG